MLTEFIPTKVCCSDINTNNFEYAYVGPSFPRPVAASWTTIKYSKESDDIVEMFWPSIFLNWNSNPRWIQTLCMHLFFRYSTFKLVLSAIITSKCINRGRENVCRPKRYEYCTSHRIGRRSCCRSNETYFQATKKLSNVQHWITLIGLQIWDFLRIYVEVDNSLACRSN